ncbi:type I restriction enzyme, R subunit [Methylomagnum ishizawai]|uniref:Type I restriction enzyme endonuclease subunit n=1 Tax=Methylomagnum ishizawai TaxID=1760988 RepID=A0A1Y6D8N4_9GAMM|nr:type I restriction endonuclease subunit R [Methylomagnum ishizawai]SMF96574.1 type I restriction enzyme, R subunit [Methylomagnum ishizawai]
MSILENDVEQALLGWFEELGYQAVFGPDIAHDGKQPERVSYKQVILAERLRAVLRKLNPKLPAAALDDALSQVLSPNVPGLVSTNRQCHRWLVGGVPVQYQQDGETRGDRVRLIDYANPAANDWWAVNQFTVEGPKHTRRPDVVVFVNGIPIAVIELKNPADENADVWAAFRQLQTYKDDIPDLFRTNEILVASDLINARMGSLTADAERFSAWRTIDGKATDPLGPMRELETLVRGVFDKALLLEYLRHFILFEDDGEVAKKIAAYHQFHAVRAVVRQVLEASQPGGNRKGGVVWHTQGAGKSIEMSCLAGKIMVDPAMKNPTLVVITDRNDLDGQLFGVFANAPELLGETPIQATSRPDLRAKLNNRPSGGIVFTTIQKFVPGEDEDSFPVLTERGNVVVICDEAHRSQYGLKARLNKETGAVQYGFAKYLRDALPNATFVAFTGTPISTEDKDTRAVFGDYVHVYDIEQAVKDGATVPIYYESRLAKLELNPEETPNIDEEVEELTEDEEASDQARLKSRWAALEKLAGAEPRIKRIAADLVAHFEQRLTVMDGKAMVVGMSREICVHLYDALVALRPEWHDEDPEKGAIKIVMTGSAADKALLKPHVYKPQVKKRLEKRFKDPNDPLKIVIVRDMWLTGFDAPCLHTMYVDKPMREHNLMQAIARVNRVFKDKPGGLVVDYIGIAQELKRALKTYTTSQGRGRPTVDVAEALSLVIEKIDVARGMLHGIDYSAFLTEALKLLPIAVNHVLGLKDGKKRFSDCVLALSKAFALCASLDEAAEYREEIAFFQAIRAVLSKGDPAKKLDDDAKEHALRQIISKAVVSDEVIDIFAAAGLNKPDVGILSETFLEDVRRMKERNLAVELLERLLKDEIKSRFATNVVQNKKFSELLKDSLTRYRNRAIETAQVIEELIQMAKEFNAAASRGEKLGLNADELAFYDALETNESSVRELGDDILRTIARELTDKLRKNLSVDWSVRDAVRARLRIMVKTILKKYKYPPDKQEAATETVLRQAETLSAAWVE